MEEWPTQCPKCGSKRISHENKGEYTGGGYGNFWSEFWCMDCEFEWRSDEKTDYY